MELGRALTRLTLQLEALEAEENGGRIVVSPPKQRANMKSIRAAEQLENERRRAMLAEIIVECAEARKDPRPCELAAEMARRLGRPFSPPQLYRSTLVDIWKPEADYFGRCAEDRVPGAVERNRMSRRLIIHHLLRTKRLVVAIEARREECLRTQSDGMQDWTKLP